MSERFSDEQKMKTALEDLSRDLDAAADEEWIHSTYEDLQGFVDGTLGSAERDIVESHLEVCAGCGASERDLRAIQHDLEAAAARPALLQAPGRTIWWQAAAVAAAVVVVAYLALLPLKNRISRLEAQIRTLEQENGLLEKQSRESALLAQELQNKIHASGTSGRQTLAPEHQELIASVTAGKELPLPAFLADLRAPQGQLLGTSQKREFLLLSPVGTAVESESPALHWTPWGGDTSYVVSVYDSQFSPVVKSEPLKTTRWKVARPLKRGEVYAWQVLASRGGQEAKSPMPPAPPAMFKVLEAKEAAGLAAVRQQAETPLQLAILYARFGVLDAAEEQLRMIPPSDPSSQVAVRLLQQIDSLRNPK